MKNLIPSIILCLSVAFPTVANAGSSDIGRIKQLEFEVTDTHQALQVNFGEGIGLKFCEESAAKYPDNAYLAPDHQNFELVSSALLMAYASGRRVRIDTVYDSARDHRCIITRVRLMES